MKEKKYMYQKSTKYYDLIYSFKDYQKQSAFIKDLILKLNPNYRTILDVACGTGEHNKYLKQHFEIDGIDINPQFIEIAKSKNPECNYYCGDMIDFHLGKKYDVVMCLFSSIGYVKTIENVRKTLICFSEHLNDNGCVIIEPWFDPETCKPGDVHMLTVEKDGTKICRMNLSEVNDNRTLSFFTFHFLVGSKDGVEHFTEYHELGIFSIEKMKNAFESADLEVDYDPKGISGRGLYIARRKS